MKIANPKADPATLAKFLEGVVGVVEDCSSFEGSCIYEKVVKYWGKDAYKQHGMGIMHTVGEIGDMPVCIVLTYNHIKGHKILFVEATSAVVDHRMVRKFLEENLPVSAFEDNDPRKRLNITDTNNWSNCIPREPVNVAA
jgi:hypothetical protein